jgi:hypothetical protein
MTRVGHIAIAVKGYTNGNTLLKLKKKSNSQDLEADVDHIKTEFQRKRICRFRLQLTRIGSKECIFMTSLLNLCLLGK